MSFESAYYGHTKAVEGGYANSSKDKRGGETFKGISRLNHPTWDGWVIVDATKVSLGLTSEKTFGKMSTWNTIDYKLRYNDNLNSLVEDFYFEEFYLPYQEHGQIEQQLRDKLFDTAINIGHLNAVKILQRSINCFLNTSTYLTIDGKIGPKTLSALTLCRTDLLLKHFVAYQIYYYDTWFKTANGKAYYPQREGFYARARWLPSLDE
jgi:lysozyme family protein